MCCRGAFFRFSSLFERIPHFIIVVPVFFGFSSLLVVGLHDPSRGLLRLAVALKLGGAGLGGGLVIQRGSRAHGLAAALKLAWTLAGPSELPRGLTG